MEYADVQAVIDAGTQEVNWVSEELEGVNLSDKRLDRRLVKTAQQLARSPVSPINEACADWASTQAAHRLVNNSKARPRAILKPHTNRTVRRMAASDGPALSVQDTVFIAYNQHSKASGPGPLATSNSPG